MDKKQVLIVDDDSLIREQLAAEVKRHFFNTLTAGNGKNALELIEKHTIDIVLLDVKLPDMDGLEILKQVKQKKPDCEIIVITGFGNQEIAIQALRWGAIDYIEKPIKADELDAAIGRAMEKIIIREKLFFKNTILVIDDDQRTLKRLKTFLEKENYEVFSAYNGGDALNTIEKCKIDIIVTDIKMSDVDGIEVIRRAKVVCRDIEGIVITGYNEQELAVKALRAGALDYLVKPLNLDELLHAIAKAIERINLKRNYLFRNRELKISAEIISKMNEELERRIQEKAKDINRIQTQLFQTSKLATLGEMAAGLAHEMNQPLGGISLVAKHFRKLIELNRLDRQALDTGLTDIETSVKRMSRIIQHIRTFARQDALTFVRVDVNLTIDSALGLLGEQLRLHEITVKKLFCKDLPRIVGEPYQLEQVWINMLTNARDAVDEKKYKRSGHKNIVIATRFLPRHNAVEVCFCDNGVGMDGSTAERVFEPFFTTKEVGKATGLGLSISYGIIESHKGKITLQSKKTKGTTVRIRLSAREHE
jgi:two-component system NtrC family sensor kinase